MKLLQRGRTLAIGAAFAAGALAMPALAQDAYVVGVSAALTGPAAATYAPVVDAMRAYMDHVNGKGGVNGKPVRLVILDNQGEPSKAAADAKKLLAQDNVLMLVNSQPVVDLRTDDRGGEPRQGAAATTPARSAPRRPIRRPIRCSSAPRRSARSTTASSRWAS